jgi:hypothetical protein
MNFLKTEPLARFLFFGGDMRGMWLADETWGEPFWGEPFWGEWPFAPTLNAMRSRFLLFLARPIF